MRIGKTLVVGLTAAGLSATSAFADTCPADYPGGNINFLVGYGAGGGTDTVARRIASDIETATGWTIVVDNRPGASGGVMARGLLDAEANGLTVGVVSNTTVAINPHVNAAMGYSHDDFAYLGTGMVLNYGLVTLADAPYDTLEEFVDYARDKGRATISVGASSHTIAVDTLAEHFDIKLIAVPGKGSAAALQEALGGHVDATIQGAAHVPQIEAGKMVQLATLTSNRASYAPDAKTAEESGVDLSIEGHIIFIMNNDTPAEVQSCLADALAAVTSSDAYVEFLAGRSAVPGNMGPEGTAAWVAEASEFYKSRLAQ
ncbi:tripartite tricarboxylate transporter substrate binding protein [Antarctobacter sp.]|uniref:tripartite tricarboxylate transporter substrate binding protein n=1 Tax=Antarctobacter sp. TaxID=1872577 RepID=UPI002B27BBA7|nr:tripartite tricarboxylate transporter substrate binding protein [Antarctobacter sp.]